MTLQSLNFEQAQAVTDEQKNSDIETLNSRYGLMMSVQEAAELLGVSKATIRTYVKKGDIPSCTIGRAFRIPRHALAQYCGLISEPVASEA